MQDIHNHLKAQDFNNLDDEESDIPTLRRINYLLQLRKVEIKNETKEVKATSVLSELLLNPSYRDPLLKIGALSRDFTLCRVFDDQNSLKSMIEHVTTPVIDSLSNSFIQTGTMRKIDLLNWPDGWKNFIYMSDTL